MLLNIYWHHIVRNRVWQSCKSTADCKRRLVKEAIERSLTTGARGRDWRDCNGTTVGFFNHSHSLMGKWQRKASVFKNAMSQLQLARSQPLLNLA